MSAPKRIQLRRTKGWRKPEGAVVVARPSKWGNPTKIEQVSSGHEARADGFRFFVDDGQWVEFFTTKDGAARHAVEVYRVALLSRPLPDLAELRGRDLACWCPLDAPCHADVLLELANP